MGVNCIKNHLYINNKAIVWGYYHYFTIILTTCSHFSTQEYMVNELCELEILKYGSKYELPQVGQDT